MRWLDVNHLYTMEGKIVPEIITKNIVIWGCGYFGKQISEILTKMGGQVVAFIDTRLDPVSKYKEQEFPPKKRFRDYNGDLISFTDIRVEQFLDEEYNGIPIYSKEKLQDFTDCNLIFMFPTWPAELGEIPMALSENVYANYPFFDKSGDDTCVFCGERNTFYCDAQFAPFLEKRMFRGIRHETRWVHCPHCEFTFSSYRPTDEEMNNLYHEYGGKEYIRQRKEAEPGFDEKQLCGGGYWGDKKRRQDVIVEFIKGAIDPHRIGTVLDYGGNQGEIIPTGFFKGSKYYVYDISTNITLPGICSVSSLEALRQMESFDFSMNCHTLEHVSYPIEIVRNITGVLKKGGYFYLEVPAESYGIRCEIHEHMNEFSARTLEVLGEVMDLEIIKIGYIPGFCVRGLYRKK